MYFRMRNKVTVLIEIHCFSWLDSEITLESLVGAERYRTSMHKANFNQQVQYADSAMHICTRNVKATPAFAQSRPL